MHRENLQLIYIPAEKDRTENIDKTSVRRIKFYTGIGVILLPLIMILIGLGVTLLLYYKKDSDMKKIEMCIRSLKSGKFSIDYKSIPYDSIKSRSVLFINSEEVLTDLQACSIESAMRQLPRKTVYLIQLLFNNHTIVNKLNKYKYLLKTYYKNAVFLTKNGTEYFMDTPLNGHWCCHNETADLAAMAATAWRFSGIILTPKLLINNKTLLSSKNKQLYISSDIFYTPVKCHRFFYQIMNNLLNITNNLKNRNEIIEDNLNIYYDIYRKPINTLTDKICGNFTCPLVFIKEQIHQNGKFLTEQLFNLCPVVMKHLKSTIENKYNLVTLK